MKVEMMIDLQCKGMGVGGVVAFSKEVEIATLPRTGERQDFNIGGEAFKAEVIAITPPFRVGEPHTVCYVVLFGEVERVTAVAKAFVANGWKNQSDRHM